MTIIAHAEPDGVEAIAKLLDELDRFYGATELEPIDLRVRQINEALFGDPPAAYALLAWDNGRLVGFAAYSFLWPAAGVTRSLYLKELYVVKASRRLGVGRLLMQSIFDVAVKYACSRVEWATDADNVDAQRFYEELGFQTLSSKVCYRAEGEELLRASELLPGPQLR